MELAFVSKALRSQEERSRNGKRCHQYEELVAQVRASDEELAEDEVEMKHGLLIAVGRLGQRVASEVAHESLLEALFACESKRSLIVSGLSVALAAVVSNRATLVGRALGTLLQLAKRAHCLESSRAVVEGVSSLVELCPQGMTKLVEAVREHYPWKGAATDSHVSYVRVALALCEKNALLEDFMLQLVVERALELDVEVDLLALSRATAAEPSFESMGTQPTLEESSRSVGDAGDHLFELDLEGSKTTPQQTEVEEIGESGEDDMATKLDSVMCLIFAYLETRIGPRTKPVGKEAVLTAALDVFEKAVLSTHESKFVQFFVFRVAASSAKRSSRFVFRLLRIIADTTASNVARIGAVAYLASFVCRAKSVDADLAAHCANCLLSWTLEHARFIWGGTTFEQPTRGHRSDSTASISPHSLKASLATPSVEPVQCASHGHKNPRLYYALFQALLYVVCFRGDELFAEPTERCCAEAQRASTGELNRSRGSLAQLDRWDLLINLGDGFQRCEPRIRIEFIKVCERAPAVFCNAFLVSLSDLRDPVSGDNSEDKHDHKLLEKEFFFPFDPYLLPRSRAYIHPVYREWIDITDLRVGRDKADTEAEQGHTSDDDEDDEDYHEGHRGVDCATYLGDASLSQGLRSPDSVSSSPFFIANSKIPNSPASLSPHDMSFDQQHQYESLRPNLSAMAASPLFRSLHAPTRARHDSVSVYGDW